jgi:hypothetical protein
LFFTILLTLTLTACATYSDSFAPIQSNLALGQYDAALTGIAKQASSDPVLYLLDKGMVLRMKRDFDASNQALEAAKQEMRRLYAASVSQHALTFFINDSTVSYGGEDYEQVLVHLYMALNYLELGQPDAARVEALQIDLKLRELNQAAGGGSYTEDAFSRYLAGMIYESNGEWSDAMISYRMAYETYKRYEFKYMLPVPDMLKNDLMRMAARVGLRNELARYQKTFNLPAPPRAEATQGELVFILSNGLSPIKRERSVTVFDPMSHLTVRIATPYFESRAGTAAGVRISVDGDGSDSEKVENIDAIARASLDAHMGGIVARSIARAVTKNAAIHGAARAGARDSQTASMLGSLAAQITALATERADTRSWLTLPANILMARLPLPAGAHNVTVDLLDGMGRQIERTEYRGVVITRGGKTFLTQHWIPPESFTHRR